MTSTAHVTGTPALDIDPGPMTQALQRRQGDPFPFPSAMLFALPEGYYATSADDSDRLAFVRVSVVRPFTTSRRPRKYQGCLKIQTQHSDDLIDRFYVEPGGKYLALSAMMPATLRPNLMRMVVDPWSAMSRYGQELGRCCRCGKALTDERSRWYGIGPECEQHWPAIIDESDEARGAFTPSVGL